MTTRLKVILFALICGLLFSALPSTAQTTQVSIDATYQQSFDKWKSGLVKNRTEEWVSLVGLYWLKPGENSFGTDRSNAIVLPTGPAKAGSFELTGTDVTVKFLPETQAIIAGKPAGTTKLEPDSSENTTVIEMGSLRMHVIVRGERTGIRVKDIDSPAMRIYGEAVFFPLDLNYRVTAKWIPSDGKRTIDVPTILGEVEPTPVAGTAEFEINGRKFQLTDIGGDAMKELFFVFNDLTTKTDTYPGGRFLKTGPVSNGTVVLDFNHAYTPPCAFTPYATCPLAPKENRLAITIPVGEKYDRTHGHR
jgi:uncharacterized protein (DUF1684 family)